MLRVREARPEDGAQLWRLVKESESLELNSGYSYVMMSRFFSDSCLVAEEDDQVIGFVAAFVPPSDPDAVFVWQIGVDRGHRGRGLAGRLLLELLKTERCRPLKRLIATVSPDNKPSMALFRSLARRLDTGFDQRPFFPGEVFPEPGHEPEHLVEVGPLALTSQPVAISGGKQHA